MSNFLDQDIISQIRSANDIVEVIQWLNVPLKKAGSSYRALCPFHKEKTPSFHVSADKQSFHCFGCGAGGDVFKFLMQRENLSFVEAAHRLAERARITIPEKSGGAAPGPSRDHRNKLYEIHEKVRDWYHTQLMRSQKASAARTYLKQRGFGQSTAKTFQLGYAPPFWDGLITWAREQKIDEKLLEECGLIIRGERGVYDRFRDRLMIPILDESGRVSGFSGRLLSNEAKEAKYVNSPETAIFKKGRLLFGLHYSKRDLQDSKTAVMCEGQLDWIRCFESGVRNVIAPQGTAFTEDQARILNRYVEQVILCFDSDTAGQNATWRNAETLIATGLTVKVARMPEKEDPDSYIRKAGAEAFKQRLSEAVDIFEYKALSLSRSLNMRNAKNHQKAVLELSPLLHLVDNEPQRQKLIHNICDILKIDVPAFLVEFKRQRAKMQQHNRFERKEEVLPAQEAFESQTVGFGDYLLRIALSDESAARMLGSHLEEAWFSNYGLRHILFHVIRRAGEGHWKSGWEAIDMEINEQEKERIAKLLVNSVQMDPRSMAVGFQEAIAGAHRTYLLEREVELLRLLQSPQLTDDKRKSFQTELLDLGLRIKQV